MPVAQASLNNILHATIEDRVAGAMVSKAVRTNPTLDIVEMQAVLKRIVTGCVRFHDGEEVIDIPAREVAQAAVAFTKLENQRRMNLGKANPAPVKSEPRKGKRSGGALRPAVVQVQPEPVQPSTEPA